MFRVFTYWRKSVSRILFISFCPQIPIWFCQYFFLEGIPFIFRVSCYPNTLFSLPCPPPFLFSWPLQSTTWIIWITVETVRKKCARVILPTKRGEVAWEMGNFFNIPNLKIEEGSLHFSGALRLFFLFHMIERGNFFLNIECSVLFQWFLILEVRFQWQWKFGIFSKFLTYFFLSFLLL